MSIHQWRIPICLKKKKKNHWPKSFYKIKTIQHIELMHRDWSTFNGLSDVYLTYKARWFPVSHESVWPGWSQFSSLQPTQCCASDLWWKQPDNKVSSCWAVLAQHQGILCFLLCPHCEWADPKHPKRYSILNSIVLGTVKLRGKFLQSRHCSDSLGIGLLVGSGKWSESAFASLGFILYSHTQNPWESCTNSGTPD